VRVIRFARIALATLSLYLLGYLLTALGVLIGCLAAFAGLRGFIRRGTVVWANMLFILVGRKLSVSGRGHIAPETSYLVVANHASIYDVPALMAAVPGIALMGKDYLMRIPGFGQLLRVLRYVPIDPRNRASAQAALAQAAQVVRAGTTVGIFPEGTRTADGRVQELKRGFVRVLRESGRDLLPVFIQGTFALKPKGRLTMDPRERIRVTLGAPIPHRELAPLSDSEIVRRVRGVLQQMGGENHAAD
jgi:1-acyl-sn-glycerol-3-phosphate acyltransferase